MVANSHTYGCRASRTTSASGSFSGKTRHIPIASGYATSIFYGDFVKLVDNGAQQLSLKMLELQH